jgi:superoxide reductase
MGAQTGQVYLCKVCGNKVKVLEAGGGVLVCCGVPMKLVENAQ